MKSPSFHDIEQLCAYLDGELTESKRERLEKRIHSDPALAAKLDEICATCELLHSLPKRRAPRNFSLTPRMARIRPPVPRLVPVFSWASAVAMLLFIFTLGTSLVGRISFGTAAPMMAAAPSSLNGGQSAAATQAPAMAAPAMAAPATAAPAIAAPVTMTPTAPAPLRITGKTAQKTPTAEAFVLSVPEPTETTITNDIQPPSTLKAGQKPINLWLIIWPALGVLLGILALLIRWLNQLAFQRKNRRR